jgi:hypothetical protein
MIIYLTFNDAPGGVFRTQVIDVCKFIQERSRVQIRLVAFISIRNFKVNRKTIKKYLPNAVVLPMVPKSRNWRWNSILLSAVIKFLKANKAICRGPFATNLALELKKNGKLGKVCFDSRGAYSAELEEYHVDEANKGVIFGLESRAVNESDFRLAVSQKLVDYWRKRFSYHGDQHVVIPCTIESKTLDFVLDEQKLSELRATNGFSSQDVIIAFSGSSAGWQSYSMIDDYLFPLVRDNRNIKVVFLSLFDIKNLKVFKSFPDQISSKWLKPESVASFLNICDYGLLLREDSVTNSVASPTKFGEYLAAGLNVIISNNVGDFSGFVLDHGCGLVVSEQNNHAFKALTIIERKKNKELAEKFFTKEVYINSYKKLIG